MGRKKTKAVVSEPVEIPRTLTELLDAVKVTTEHELKRRHQENLLYISRRLLDVAFDALASLNVKLLVSGNLIADHYRGELEDHPDLHIIRDDILLEVDCFDGLKENDLG